MSDRALEALNLVFQLEDLAVVVEHAQHEPHRSEDQAIDECGFLEIAGKHPVVLCG
jgi:hypothetical protein